MSNLTRAVFTDSEYCTTETPLWQFDYGQQLQIFGIDLPETFEAHFSNDPTGESKTQIGQDGVVTIPDEYLLNSGYLYVWVYLHSSVTDGETRYQIKAKIRERATPSDTPPTPQQQDVITEAIAALNDGVTRSEAAAASAEAAAAYAEAVAYTYIYEQAQPSDTWTIQHNLHKYPSVSIVDTAGSAFLGEVHYIDENSLTVSFAAAVAGYAYLN